MSNASQQSRTEAVALESRRAASDHNGVCTTAGGLNNLGTNYYYPYFRVYLADQRLAGASRKKATSLLNL